MKRRVYHLAAAAVLLALISAAPAAPADGDGLVLLRRDSPDYAGLAHAQSIISHPDAGTRLLVFRADQVVFDHGLRDDWAATPDPGALQDRKLFADASVVESVELAPDGLTAILMETRIRPTGKDGALEGGVTLTWVDPEHPRGKWSLGLPEGRFVTHVHVLDRQSGFALMTATPDGQGADFALYGPDGDEEFRVDEVVGRVLEFRITRAAGFVGLDISYPDQPDLPDRTLLILDRLQSARWAYSWSYGSDREPTSWTLMDNGVLEIRTPGKTALYDRTGLEIVPQNEKRRRKRLRN